MKAAPFFWVLVRQIVEVFEVVESVWGGQDVRKSLETPEHRTNDHGPQFRMLLPVLVDNNAMQGFDTKIVWIIPRLEEDFYAGLKKRQPQLRFVRSPAKTAR